MWSGIDDRRAGVGGELLGARRVDVGDAQPGAFGRGMHRNAGGDAARALQRDVQPRHAVLAQRALDRRLDAEEHAQRRVRPGIAADRAALGRETGNEAGLAADFDHVGNAHPDVFGSDVAATKRIDRATVSGEQFGRLGEVFAGEQHGLAAAQWQARHRVLVAHPARQPQRVGQRVVVVGIMPEAHPARRRPEMGRMQRDDRA